MTSDVLSMFDNDIPKNTKSPFITMKVLGSKSLTYTRELVVIIIR